MKIGVFDSGLGGLVVGQALIDALPEYDYLYLGDTARVPYGTRSQETIRRFTMEAVDYLFQQDCALVIIACNTASAEALRFIQQSYLPTDYPERRVLGVLIPAAEEVAATFDGRPIGVLATPATVASQSFPREICKLLPEAHIVHQAAPLLVPLLENDGQRWTGPILESYLEPLLAQGIGQLVLGCTHYPLLKDDIRRLAGPSVQVICQDEILPDKLRSYLSRHPELESQLSKHGSRRYLATDLSPSLESFAATFLGSQPPLEKVVLTALP